MTDTIRLVLDCPVVPYTRMTQRGKWVKENRQAQRYLENQHLLSWSMRAALGDLDTPVFGKTKRLKADYIISGRYGRADLSNLVKAIEDAANGILWYDDRQIDESHEVRVNANYYETRIEVEVLNA